MQAELDLLDPIRELRLRTWARRNHVPARNRDSRWHEVILDEMARCDLDIMIAETTEEPFDDWLGPMLAESSQRLESQRCELAELRADREPVVETPAVEDEPLLVETMVSAFVPLAPGPFRMVHEAHVTLPGPHFGGVRDQTSEIERLAIPECW